MIFFGCKRYTHNLATNTRGNLVNSWDRRADSRWAVLVGVAMGGEVVVSYGPPGGKGGLALNFLIFYILVNFFKKILNIHVLRS